MGSSGSSKSVAGAGRLVEEGGRERRMAGKTREAGTFSYGNRMEAQVAVATVDIM